MEDLELLVDLFAPMPRQGPGSKESTLLAAQLAGLYPPAGGARLQIADLGCGTGAAALVLAEALGAQVAAVDLFPAFLELLQAQAQAQGLSERIRTHALSMDALPFAPASLDAIWAEGAVYNIGFEQGAQLWWPLLKAGGILAVSELSWFTTTRPPELDAHWQAEYPGVDTVSAKIAALERLGYRLLGYFPLPSSCWLAHYYLPLSEQFAPFLARHAHSAAAQATVKEQQKEMALYEAYQAYYGYGFYIAQKA